MTCEQCQICGLVLENHDYDMAAKCVSSSGTTTFELNMKYLHQITKSNIGKVKP